MGFPMSSLPAIDPLIFQLALTSLSMTEKDHTLFIISGLILEAICSNDKVFSSIFDEAKAVYGASFVESLKKIDTITSFLMSIS